MKLPQPHLAPARVNPESNETEHQNGKKVSPPPFQLKADPTAQPSSQPSTQPSSQPTSQPSSQPTSQPSSMPATQPVEKEESAANKEVLPPLPKYDLGVEQAAKCVDTEAHVGDKWVDFANGFNTEFQSILHVFTQEEMGCVERPTHDTEGAKAPTKASVEGKAPEVDPKQRKYPRKMEKTGPDVSAATLESLFTETQRDKLLQYFMDHKIPERLFNGDDRGHTTAQQRLLMACRILESGTYNQAGFEQKTHARMCWHWVHITHDYAGVSVGVLNKGMMGTTDQFGNVVLGTGEFQSIYHGDKVVAGELPTEEQVGTGIGGIKEWTSHEEAMCKQDQEQYEDPTKELAASAKIGRLRGLAWERFDEVQPGDWIWDYNSNGSTIGAHSMIFSRWISGEQTLNGVRYRQAVCFSQGSADGGGREHEVNLGEAFTIETRTSTAAAPTGGGSTSSPTTEPSSKPATAAPQKPAEGAKKAKTAQKEDPKGSKKKKKPKMSACDPTVEIPEGGFYDGLKVVSPILYVTRVSEDSRPATSVEELLPAVNATEGTAKDVNEYYIRKIEWDNQHPLDRDALFKALRKDGSENLAKIHKYLTPMQEKMFEEALNTTSLRQLVWTVQRIRGILHNANKHQELLAAEQTKGLKEKHDEVYASNRALFDEYDPKVKAAQEEKVWNEVLKEGGSHSLKVQKEKLDTLNAELEGVKKKIKAGEKDLKKLKPDSEEYKKKSEELEKLKAERDKWAAEIAAIKAKIKGLNAEMAAYDKAIAKETYAITRLKDERKKKAQGLPYSIAHPGNWTGKDVTSLPSGRLAHVFPEAVMKGFLTDGALPEGTKMPVNPEAKKKKKKK